MNDYRKYHPKASEGEVLTHARMYVSDPAIKVPPHCCGAAVDIDLLDISTNQLVDFGSPVNEDAEISHLHYGGITKNQKENRQYLLSTMLKAGFSSYYAEWWHYSYGDQIWAWFYGRDMCLYDIVERD
jgi:D-alanyl-D-alanine dipeptidase